MTGLISPQSHLTRLKGVTAKGELLITTEDRAIQDKVLAAHDGLKSFVIWNGQENEIVTGRVTSTLPTEPFEFAILPEEAIGGP